MMPGFNNNEWNRVVYTEQRNETRACAKGISKKIKNVIWKVLNMDTIVVIAK